ncbi:MAG: transcriptional regulator [Pedosphaera sp.]|nr:transcriptional regulator [Pedosphaera sp.]
MHFYFMEENEKRTMTLNLTPREMAVLEDLAAKKDLSKTGVMRLALRLLQAVDAKIQLGQKLMVEDEKTKEKIEMVLI